MIEGKWKWERDAAGARGTAGAEKWTGKPCHTPLSLLPQKQL